MTPMARVRSSMLTINSPTDQSHRHAITVRPRVLIDNNVSASHTAIEVNGCDRPGLLHELTRAITAPNLQIASAKISTYGEKAAAHGARGAVAGRRRPARGRASAVAESRRTKGWTALAAPSCYNAKMGMV
jgi:hypothetical protein